MSARTRSWDPGRFALYGGVLAAAGVCLFPYLVMLSTAVKPASEITGQQEWLPRSLDIGALTSVWTQDAVLRGLRNSFIIATGITVVALVCAVPGAYVLARQRFRGRRSFMTTVLVTQMLSPVVVLVPLFETMTDLSLLGSFAGVILVGAAFIVPFCVWVLAGFFSAIAQELVDAATLDHCGRLAILRHLILPLSIPGLAATAVYAFLFGWNEFVISLTFLSATPDKWPVSVGVFSSVGQWNIGWQSLMATALVSTFPVLFMFAFVQKYLDRGFSTLLAA